MRIDKQVIDISAQNEPDTIVSKESKNKMRKRNYFLRNTSIGIIIYTLTFFCWYFFKRSTFLLEPDYQDLFFYYLFSIIISSVFSNKAFLTREHEFSQSLRKIYISLTLSLGLLSFILLILDSGNLSRYVILGSMITGAAAESIYFYLISINKGIKKIIDSNPVSWKYTIPDFILLSFSIYIFVIDEIQLQNINERHQIIIILIYFMLQIWIQ